MPFQQIRISFISIALICIFNSNEAYSQEKVLDVGEELQYEVSFGFIKLGYVKFILSNSRKEGKKIFYNSKLEVKTYPEVPFLKLNEIYESEMESDEKELFSRNYFETDFKDRSITRTDYRFNYPKKFVKINKDTDGNIEKNDRVIIKDNVLYKDELCWHYGARINSFTNKNYNIPVFVNSEESSVRYSFNVNKTVVKIEKYDYDIGVIKMEGTCDFTGLFGIKGEFLILLSDDEYRVPIKAYFNSSLGNVVWELISYKKNKWTPPAFLK
ncbi:MAG: DUF3108 domain-containing protein [Ignavibacteria bacterium]|nr:DUF3108 domain-containing protein [Ignavibacteria bacterium]MBL0106062.1 DUF3108 domain-containing protein [Ignavibacteria bacterium]